MAKKNGGDQKAQSNRNIFQKIFDVSIGRVRVFSVLILLVGLALIGIGIFNIFNIVRDNTVSPVAVEDGDGSIDGDAVSDESNQEEKEKTPEVTAQEPKQETKEARVQSVQTSQNTGKWVATDYKEGDIDTGNYEVVRGDTLWEIAEATYGSGFEWTKILAANSDAIGYLPNGSQALIIPGQVLIVP